MNFYLDFLAEILEYGSQGSDCADLITDDGLQPHLRRVAVVEAIGGGRPEPQRHVRHHHPSSHISPVSAWKVRN